MVNTAAAQGWVKSTDPKSGKTFYANHVTRVTQWEPPSGWNEETTTEAPLPPNWESMKDPSTGKTFYINHATKVTQWTRPEAPVASAPVSSLQPAVASYSAGRAKSFANNSYQQEAFYYQPSVPKMSDVDLSDSLPLLDFKVQTVADALRTSCGICEDTFTTTKRRHHCRLCGDVICDACSPHRELLPLEGPEFSKPVRICELCYPDVQQSNYFSTRRYLTILNLYNGTDVEVANANNVNAALSSLSQDLISIVQGGEDLKEKITVPANILVPAVMKALRFYETSNYAVVCIASLLSLENVLGQSEFAELCTSEEFLDILERTGSDRRTLYVQEQAAKVLYYLTEPKLLQSGRAADAIDIPRSCRSMLDHASNTGNPNLQRWASSTLTHLIQDDQRRACMAVNEMAANLGDVMGALSYTSHLPDLVQTGGVMILGSLVSSDDADTRAHALTSLGTILSSSRAIYNANVALAEMTGGEYGNVDQSGDIVRAIVTAGGCAGSVAQLLLSADDTTAGMACQFLHSLVKPLLLHAGGSLPSCYEPDNSNLGACREAALDICTSSNLPALLSLVKTESRGMELRKLAMETLAGSVMAIGDMGKSWAGGSYEEGLARAPSKLREAIMMLNEEQILQSAVGVLESAKFGQSLGSANETPASRMRECAGMLLSAVTSCSAEAIMELQAKNILSRLLISSTEQSMTVPSTLRGDGAPRCLGVLETVAAQLYFMWQQQDSGEEVFLELMDAGAVGYVSRVLCTKMDWESADKAVGSMKGRAGACRLFAALYGMAKSDMAKRRMVEAIHSDAHNYNRRSSSRSSNQRSPTNVMEAILGVLQASSSICKKTLIGGASVNQQSEQYQSAVRDLVEASLLAAGSLCGSSVPPGCGGLDEAPRVDCRNMCALTCNVVNGNRSSYLPTMIVGGFGEGSVLPSLRLSLAIARNGGKDEHSKLAHSGILVPISDLLKSALSSGDIYKFSSSLALVRFCGPHVSAGQGGAVRDAIKTATSVLTLPVNPAATEKEAQTQESLKSECISALESLSKNSSLWSAISTEALPSMIRFLSTPGTETNTACTALRAVLQIVQVPSHSLSAAESGIVPAVSSLLSSRKPEISVLALQVLHAIAGNDQARQRAQLLESGLVKSVAAAIGKATLDPNEHTGKLTFLGLEILQWALRDVEGNLSMEELVQSPRTIAYLHSIAAEPQFVMALCSTLLAPTGMKLVRPDTESATQTEFEIPSLYGLPVADLPDKSCGGYDAGTRGAAESLLFTCSVYACAMESEDISHYFWQTVLLQNQPNAEKSDCLQAAASFAAQFLSLLSSEHRSFIPLDMGKHEAFLSITRPLLRHKLLDVLKSSMEELSDEEGGHPFVTSLLVAFNVPHICLSLWQDPALLDLAFDLIKQIVDQDPDEILHLFVEGKPAIMSLFDLLNLDGAFEASTNVTEIRAFLASVLGQLAETGLLASAVKRFDVRSSAIAALAAACLNEEERAPEEDADMTSASLSTVLMGCLVQLCTVTETGDDGSEKKRIQLHSAESIAIAKNLGKKICHMVLSRFLERSKLQQYEMDDDESIMDAPEVAMLCAIAQHDEALNTLRGVGGLHALSLVAGEGEITALEALKKACNGDASVLLEGDTYISMMGLLGSDSHDNEWKSGNAVWRKLETLAFELLADLCRDANQGRSSVASADTCPDCVARAMEIIKSFSSVETEAAGGESSDEAVEDDHSDDVEDEQEASVKPTDYGRCVAAFGFLSALSPARVAISQPCDDDQFVAALKDLVSSSPSNETRLAAVKASASLSLGVDSQRPLSATVLDEMYNNVLSSGKKCKSTSTFNSNLMNEAAVSGLTVILDLLDEDSQLKHAKTITALFVKSVKSCVAGRSVSANERVFAAELSFALTSCMLRFASNYEIYSQDVLIALAHMIQWHRDPKTSVGASDKAVWDSSVGNCVSLLSTQVWRPDVSLEAAGIDLSVLSKGLMLVRAGKAPRKAIDLKSALESFDERSCVKSTAQKLILRIFP